MVGTAISGAGSGAVGRSPAPVAVPFAATISLSFTSAGVATTRFLPSIYTSSVLTVPPQSSSVALTPWLPTAYSATATATADLSDSQRDRMPRSLMTSDILQQPSRGLSQLSPTAVTTSGEYQFDKDSQVSSVSALSRTNMSAASTATVVPAQAAGLTGPSAAPSGTAVDHKDSGALRAPAPAPARLPVETAAALRSTSEATAPPLQKVPEKTFQSSQLGIATSGPLHTSPSSLGSPLKSGRSALERAPVWRTSRRAPRGPLCHRTCRLSIWTASGSVRPTRPPLRPPVRTSSPALAADNRPATTITGFSRPHPHPQ